MYYICQWIQQTYKAASKMNLSSLLWSLTSFLQAYVTYVTLKKELNIQDILQCPVCTYLHAGAGLCFSYNTFTFFEYSISKDLEL